MVNLAQFDLRAPGREAKIRALLEDLIQAHIGFRPDYRLALAVWFQKSVDSDEQHLLELVSGPPFQDKADDHHSLLWKSGVERPPFVKVSSMWVDYFAKLSATWPDQTAAYRLAYEVLYFDKDLLPVQILEFFGIVTEPPGLIKGWYVAERQFADANGSISNLLARHGSAKPSVGLVKTSESPDFEHCHGVLHREVGQKWWPLTPEGIEDYAYYNDRLEGRTGYFLFEGGSLYKILKFEVKTAPQYAGGLLGTTPNDRYPEVYLRAVHEVAQPTT